MTSAAALVLALAAAAPGEPPADTVLLLVGDAGTPDPRGEPVLRALSAAAAQDPVRTTVVFLGDNVYPRGLPPPGDAERPEGERRLVAQLDAVRIPGLRTVFVPGNHDWAASGRDGWDAVLRSAAFVRERGPESARQLPEGGCPGPEILDLGARVRLLLLDTQWFLHAHEKPRHPASSCAADSEEEVVAAVQAALRGAPDREVVVAAHHPLASGGPHGGHFSVRQHLFPLTDWKPWLWIPLPLIGSSYPAARKGGASPQDLSSAENEGMRAALLRAFEARPPLAFAAGHEHNLQVIARDSPRYILVSGSGILGHTSGVRKIQGTRFARDHAGFMRLAFPRAGPPLLEVLGVAPDGSARALFSLELR
ncbi:MAG TPA: hypothetical protein VFM88_14785 [Vicinamibacteria bacterium]|nr:hypothetical protein [Vicinamibacteria bacterium]